jgi:hypothetical protein
VTAAGDPFKSMTWLAALEVATSRCGADPARLAAAGEEEFLALVRDAAPGWGTPRPDWRIARKVLALADDPDATAWSRRGLFRRIRDELGDLQRARRQLKEVEADMTALLAELGLARLGDIPGLTLAGAAVILGETGEPAATRPLRPWSSMPGCRRRTTRRGRPRAPRGSRGAAGPRCASRPGGDVRDAELEPGHESQVRDARRGGGGIRPRRGRKLTSRLGPGRAGRPQRPRGPGEGPRRVRRVPAALDLLHDRARRRLGPGGFAPQEAQQAA